MNYGKKLKEYRKKRKMTQEQLAEQLCVSPTTLYNWENGVSKPKEENRKALNELLHLDEIEAIEETALAEVTAAEKSDGKEEPSLEISVVSREDLCCNASLCAEEASLQSELRKALAQKRRLQLALQIVALLVLLCLELFLTVFVAMNFFTMIFPLEGDGANSNINFPFSWGTFWLGVIVWIAFFVGMDIIVRKMIKNIKNIIKDRKEKSMKKLVGLLLGAVLCANLFPSAECLASAESLSEEPSVASTAVSSEAEPRLFTKLDVYLNSEKQTVTANVKNTFTLFPSTVEVYIELYSSATPASSYQEMERKNVSYIADLDIGKILTTSAPSNGETRYWQGRAYYRIDGGGWQETLTEVVKYDGNGNLLSI